MQYATQVFALFTDAKRVMEAKNRDYSGASSDPFANFRSAELLGISPHAGIALRCMDKLMRVRTFLSTGALAVKSESVIDALSDQINYGVLMAGFIRTIETREDLFEYHGRLAVDVAQAIDDLDRKITIKSAAYGTTVEQLLLISAWESLFRAVNTSDEATIAEYLAAVVILLVRLRPTDVVPEAPKPPVPPAPLVQL